MRSGKLDRTIHIETIGAVTPDGYGVADPATAASVTTQPVRAQIVQASTEEYLRGYGEGENTAIVFRIRFLAGVTPERGVIYEDRKFNIREVKEIGRRAVLELRCEEVRS